MTAPSLPESFKSLTYTQPSTPPHLHHQPLKPPAPTELLIKVKAAAINPVDIQLWNNKFVGWLAGKKEKGIGRDFSGIIVGVGEQFEGKGKWEVGDEVWGLHSDPTGDGTFTEYLKLTSADPLAKKPKCWTFEEAASVPLVALTAFTCLDWLPKEKEGEKRRVVVAGASGGVGLWCVQLAKKVYNCHVIGVCSSKNAEFVRTLGADEVIDYTSQDVPKILLENRPDGRKYDLYIDCVGGVDMFNHWYDLLHKNAAYITIVGDKTDRTTMGGPVTYVTHPSQMLRFVRGWLFGPRFANVILKQRSDWLEKVAALAEKKEVDVVVQEVVNGILEENSGAWEKVYAFMEKGRVRGKIVVDINGDSVE